MNGAACMAVKGLKGTYNWVFFFSNTFLFYMYKMGGGWGWGRDDYKESSKCRRAGWGVREAGWKHE